MNNLDRVGTKTRVKREKGEKGSALIVALGVLMLMVFLGILLSRISISARQASTAWADKVQTRILAQSGVEMAIKKRFSQTGPYRGEDWNGDGLLTKPVPPGSKSEDWNGNDNGTLDRACDPKYALAPHYFVDRDKDGRPDLIPVVENGKTKYRGFSGELPSTYGGGHDFFSVKVEDNSGKINVNSLNENVGEMIDTLYGELTGGGGTPGTSSIIPSRPPVTVNWDTLKIQGGYQKIEDLKTVLSTKEYELLEPHLVIHHRTWVDTSTIEPKPQNSDTDDYPNAGRSGWEGYIGVDDKIPDNHPGRPSGVVFETQSGPGWGNEPGNANPLGIRNFGRFQYEFDYDMQPRAPVNVNQADKAVLVALISNLKARILEIVTHDSVFPEVVPFWEVHVWNPQFQTRVIPGKNGISRSTARTIAAEIDDYRSGRTSIQFRGRTETGPIESWPEFEAFVDRRVVTAAGVKKEIGQMLKAHFNPNTRFAKFNWNNNAKLSWETKQGRAFLDKTDFLYHTVEFTLQPTGYYEIKSFGCVTNRNNEIMAESSLKTVYHGTKVLKHTSMRDFHVNKVKNKTFRTTLYPENGKNVGWNNIEKGYDGSSSTSPATGSEYSGMISVSPKENEGNGSSHHYWDFSTPGIFDDTQLLDPTVDVNDPPNISWGMLQIIPKEFSDVDDDTTSDSHGALGGAYSPDEHHDVFVNHWSKPDPDPWNYSDILPDGYLDTSDRFRLLRYKTSDESGHYPDDWEQGHVEFWWKPRQDLDKQDDRYVISLWNQWFLSDRSMLVNVPVFDDSSFRAEGPSNPVPNPSDVGLQLINPKEYINQNCDAGWGTDNYYHHPGSYNKVAWEFKDMSGFHLEIFYKHEPNPKPDYPNGYYFAIRYYPFMADNVNYYKSSWSGDVYAGTDAYGSPETPERTDMDVSDYTVGRVFAIVPVSSSVSNAGSGITPAPQAGQWNHVVANWKPVTKSLDYDSKFMDVKLLGGNLWVNGNQNPKTYYFANNWQQGFGGSREFRWSGSLILTSSDVAAVSIQAKQNWGSFYHNYGYIGGYITSRFGTDHGPYDTLKSWSVKDPMPIYQHLKYDPENSYRTTRFPRRDGEGTFDEVYISSSPGNANGGDGVDPDRYYRKSEGPTYTARVKRRQDLNGFHDYSEVDQRVFLARPNDPVQIVRIAHTQYLPALDYNGNSIAPDDRSYFQFDFKTEKGSGFNAFLDRDGDGVHDDPWLGEARTPEELGGPNNYRMKNTEAYLQYRITPQNMERDPQNVTPFLDDVIIYYRVPGGGNIDSYFYYFPESK